MPHELDLERMALGERPTQDDPQVQQALAEIMRSDEEILRAYPPERIAAQIRKRALGQTQRRSRLGIMSAAGAFGFMIVAAVVVWPMLERESTERTKGLGQQLHVWRKTALEPQALSEGTLVRPGDVLQLGYVSGGRRYGVIASLDGRGEVTLHYPANPAAEARLSPQPGTVLLDSAYELDEAPSFERFFLITSDEHIDTEQVLGALRDLAHGRDAGRMGEPRVRGKVNIVSIRVDKDNRP